MLYPDPFPIHERPEPGHPERTVYECFRELPATYDVFYSQRFQASSDEENETYEVDFIVLHPTRGCLLIEVKGGLIGYNGENHCWFQNKKKMKKSPVDQILSCQKSMLNRYVELKRNMAIGWALCFPQCELPKDVELPTQLNRDTIIDQRDLGAFKARIESLMKRNQARWPGKKGLSPVQYQQFKDGLLHGLGMVSRLGTAIAQDRQAYIKLTDYQYEALGKAVDNDRLVVRGVAGSGKTILAVTLARDWYVAGKSVVLLCHNRSLALVLQEEFPEKQYDRSRCFIGTFLHFARTLINDDTWWEAQDHNADFWNLGVPAKLETVPANRLPKFDALIIDEGQDFCEFWFELLFKKIAPDGKTIVFLDPRQDVFDNFTRLPLARQFFKYRLDHNCRNAQEIIRY